MKKYFYFLISIIFMITLLTSCASISKTISMTTAKPFIISNSVNQNTLSQKAIFLDIIMLEREFPSTPLVPAQKYKQLMSSLEKELDMIQLEKINELNEIIPNLYEQTYSSEIIKIESPFKDKITKIDFFNTITDDIKQQIQNICIENNSDLLITSIATINTINPSYEIISSELSVIADTNISMEMCIFNKSGTLLTTIHLNTRIFEHNPNNFDSFSKIFDNLYFVFKLMIDSLAKE